MRSVKALAAFVLIVGGPAIGFLTFAVAVSFLFSLFAPPGPTSQVLGYAALAGPLPLGVGAVLLFLSRTQRLGARLTLVGSVILTVYLIVCYTRLDVNAVRLSERLLWFGLVPLAVLAVDYAAYRIYLLVKQPARPAGAGTGPAQ